MEIVFRATRLAKMSNSDRALQAKYGLDMARAIMNRLAVLKNARTLSEVLTDKPGRPHQLSGRRSGQYAVDLVHPCRLVFKPDHEPLPRRADGGVDTDQVTAITIIEIVDYH